MINIDMDAIKARMARVVRDERGKVKVFNTGIVDDAVALLAEVERLNKAYTELAKALPEVCFGGCTGDSSVGIPDCPLVEYQQDGKPRCKYAPELEIAPRAAMTRESPFDTGNPATANRVLSLAEVLALPDGARVYLEYRDPLRGCVAKKETAYGQAFICAVGGEMHGLYGLNAEYLIGGDKPLARVWSLPVAPTEEEKRENPWEVEG